MPGTGAGGVRDPIRQLAEQPAGAAPPAVTDTGLRVDATAITIGLATNAVSATGAVSSVMQPSASRSGAGTARTPALLADDQPLFASAAALEYDSQTRKATYTGPPGDYREDVE